MERPTINSVEEAATFLKNKLRLTVLGTIDVWVLRDDKGLEIVLPGTTTALIEHARYERDTLAKLGGQGK